MDYHAKLAEYYKGEIGEEETEKPAAEGSSEHRAPTRRTTPAKEDPAKAQLHRLVELHAEVAKQISEALLEDAAQAPAVTTPEIWRNLSSPQFSARVGPRVGDRFPSVRSRFIN
jgi:hypothetical protein